MRAIVPQFSPGCSDTESPYTTEHRRGGPMLALLVAFGVVALIMPTLTRWLGRQVFFVAALVPLIAFIAALLEGPRVVAGTPIAQAVNWIPELGLSISLRMDTLSWLLTLIVTGVGALVLIYCARYFENDEAALGRFAGLLLAFAGAMYGLVLADDVYLLFVFWEATSVLSYLLIGHYTGKKASRGAALQALLVTTLGGLVMLVGVVLLAVEAGTSSLSEIIAAGPTDTISIVAVMLVLVGAASKSAIVPFQFWLPAAMAAPTPVSAYLHAAAMVKAGIYLVARFAPGFAETPGWREVVVVLGLATMLLGGWNALKQNDLKLILAWSTVSQLGFLFVVVGYGTQDAALAGIALLLAHALYKSTLFLAIGIIDHRAGTRDLRKISGLGRRAPVLAVVCALALGSMIGFPPTIGYVAKEAAFTALLTDAESGVVLGWIALVGVVLASVLTVAYCARFMWGAFATKPGVEKIGPVRERPLFWGAPVILAATGLVLGLAAPVVDHFIVGYSALFATEPASLGAETYHLALWHGFEPALAFSALTLVLGAALFFARNRVAHVQERVAIGYSAADGYGTVMRAIDRTAARTTGLTQRGSLPFYLGVILTVFVVAVGASLVINRTWTGSFRLWDYPVQAVIGLIMVVAAIAVTRATKRFQAAVLVGVTGMGMAALFALQGAPDLALTQVLVEIVTLIAFVLVLRRLPARLGTAHGRVKRGLRIGIGIAVGTIMGTVAFVATGARTQLPISVEWPALAFDQGHGRNVVNVALVDIRGWDTMGELAVIIAAATGVASLVFISGRGVDNLPKVGRRDAQLAGRATLRNASDPSNDERGAWLLAGRALAERNHSILLEVVVRLLFHPIIVLSLYLLLAGHNAPGGGFAGGIVAGMALVARFLAGGRHELGAAAPVDAGKVLGAGLVLAVGTAIAPLFFGRDALASTLFEAEWGIFGHVEFVTSTFFDIGVYLVIVGLILDVLRSLGAEVDRQYEEDEVAANPQQTANAGEVPS